MKSMKKVLASLLALAMVVTAVPVTSASAATTASTNKSSAVVYADSGKTTTVKVTTPSTWKNVKLTATPKRSTVVTTKVNSSKQIVRFYAQTSEVENTKVVISVSYKENGVKKSKKLAVQAYVRDVKVKFASDETGAEEITSATVAVGGTTTLNVFTAPASIKDDVTLTSSDESIVKVEDGSLVGVAEGTTTVTAEVTYGDKTVTTTCEITVEPAELQSVEQATLTTINAVFSGDASSYTESDITVTNNYTSVDFSVKSVNADGTDMVIETYVDMNDGQEYSVTCNGVTKTFIATDGTVANIAVDPTVITEAEETEIDAILSDANGVIVGTYAYDGGSSITAGSNTLDFTIDVTDGYTSGAKLYLNEAGDTATASLTYHSGTFDEDGNEVGNQTQEATITAEEAATVTVSSIDALYSKTLYTSYTYASDGTIAAGDTGYAYLQLTFSDDSTSVNFSDYTVESSNANTAIVSVKDAEKGVYDVTANEAGTVNLIVKKDGTTVDTVALTVKAARTANKLSLSSTSLSLSTKCDSTATVTATVLDQYGDSMAMDDFSADGNLSLLNTPSTSAAIADVVTGASITSSGVGSISVDVSGAADVDEMAEGNSRTYSIKVTCEGLSKTLTIVAKKPYEEISKYGLELSSTSVDAVITADLTGNTEVTASVYSYDKNGVKIANVTDSVDEFAFSTDAVGATTGSTITVNNISKGTKMPTGTYKVTATYTDDGKTSTYTKSFTVTDSQPEITQSVLYISGTSTDLNDYIQVVYNGTAYGADSGKENDGVITGYTKSDGTSDTSLTSGKSTYVKTITVTIDLGSNKLVQTITVGKTITVS